jgi:hypothetical protein
MPEECENLGDYFSMRRIHKGMPLYAEMVRLLGLFNDMPFATAHALSQRNLDQQAAEQRVADLAAQEAGREQQRAQLNERAKERYRARREAKWNAERQKQLDRILSVSGRMASACRSRRNKGSST